MPDANGLAEALRPDLLKIFKPAFLGRVTLVPYFPLSPDSLKLIIKLQLGRIQKRIAENYGAQLSYSPEVVDSIAVRCTESESGARNIENVIARGLLPELSARFLEKMANGETFRDVRLSLDTQGAVQYSFA
jgi:type VI secretion system protein VasG